MSGAAIRGAAIRKASLHGYLRRVPESPTRFGAGLVT